METSLQKIIAAIVGVMILFIIPVYIAYEKVDDVSYSLALKLTQNFVDNVRDKGYISPEMYTDFVSGLYATNNTYDVSIEHVKKRYDPAIYIYEKKEDNTKGRLIRILDYKKYLTKDGELPTTVTLNEEVYNRGNSNITVENASITNADGTQINFTNGGEEVLTPEELYKLKIDEYKSQNRIILDEGEIYADIRKLTGSNFDKEIYRPAYITLNSGKITLMRKQGVEPDTINYNDYIGNYDVAKKNGSKYFEGPVYDSNNSKIVYTPAAMYVDGMSLTAEQAKDFYYTWKSLYEEALESGDGRLVYDVGEVYADRYKVKSVGNSIDTKIDNIADITIKKGSIKINEDKLINGFETELDYDKYITAYDQNKEMVAYEGEIYNNQNSNILVTKAAMWTGSKKYDELSEAEKIAAENLYDEKINTDLYKNEGTIVLNKGRIFAESEAAIGYNSLTDEIRNIEVTGEIKNRTYQNALYIDTLDFGKYISEYRTTGKIIYDNGGTFTNGQNGISIIHSKGRIETLSGRIIDYSSYIDEILNDTSDTLVVSNSVEFGSDDVYIENAKVIVNETIEKSLTNISEIREIKRTGKVMIEGVEYDSNREGNADTIQIVYPTFIALQNQLSSDIQVTSTQEIQSYIEEYIANEKITYSYNNTYLKNSLVITHEAVYINDATGNKYMFLQHLNKNAYNNIFTANLLSNIDNGNATVVVPVTIYNALDIEVTYGKLKISGESDIDITNETMQYVEQYYLNKRIVFEEGSVATGDDINVIHPKIEVFQKNDTANKNAIFSYSKNKVEENSEYVKYLTEFNNTGNITIKPARIYTREDVTVTRSKITILPEEDKLELKEFDDTQDIYNQYINEFERTGKITIVSPITYSTESEITMQDAHISITPTGYTTPMIDIYEEDNSELYNIYLNEYLANKRITLKYQIDDVEIYRANITLDKLLQNQEVYTLDTTQIIYDNTDLNGDGVFEYQRYKSEYEQKSLITFSSAKQISASDLKVVDPSITVTDINTGEVIIKYEADYSQLTDEQRYQIYNLKVQDWNKYFQVVNKQVTYTSGENCIIEKAHVVNEEIITDKQIVSKIFKDTGVSKIEFLRSCMLGNGDKYNSLRYMDENSYVMNEGDQINVTVRNRNQTIASVFYSMFTANVGNEEIPKIYVNYGGTIKNSGNTIISEEANLVEIGNEKMFKYKGKVEEISLAAGQYEIQAWGASGGGDKTANSSTTGGKGSYVKAVFNISTPTMLYVYVGGEGTKYSDNNEENGGFNGGGNSYNGFGGGGASDVRLIKGDSDDIASLLSRIVVAAGGGGSSKARENVYGAGGAGGNLSSAKDGTSVGVNQLLVGRGAISSAIAVGYNTYTNEEGTIQNIPQTEKGGLGKGGSVDFDGAGGGGSGYFGGSASHDEYAGGGGGLSFIYQNEVNVIGGERLPLKMIFESQYEQSIIDKLKNKIDENGKWLGISYESGETKDGNSNMPTPLYSGTESITGNKGNGVVIIKKIKNI